MKFELKYKQFGECSILIIWPERIDVFILKDVLAFKSQLEHANVSNIQNCNHAYASLLITYNIFGFNISLEIAKLKSIYKSLNTVDFQKSTLWKIPVCYDVSFGIDLEALSIEKQIAVSDVIKYHSTPIYTIYFTGFLPGFLYLGGLDKRLFTPRKAIPRLKIEKGAVAIGGEQTGIYPNESPGGWNIIGNSPVQFFNVNNIEPCFARAGDNLQFYPVTLKEFQDIKTLVEAGVYHIESEEQND